MFIEDVESNLRYWFFAFDEVGLASSCEINENEMLINWFDKPAMSFFKLKFVLQVAGVDLILVHEIDGSPIVVVFNR